MVRDKKWLLQRLIGPIKSTHFISYIVANLSSLNKSVFNIDHFRVFNKKTKEIDLK